MTVKGQANIQNIGSGQLPQDQPTIVSLTDSTGGTVSDTLNDTTSSVKDDLASLAGKINEILTELQDLGLRV